MNDVIKLTRQNHIATVIMDDRESKNTFTTAFMQGMLDAFAAIKKDEYIKVVVLHGFDNYFCCGGTKEELVKIYEGKGIFTDLHVHDLLLNCDVPVISAMQGHALGGGLALASFADILVMGKQCLYSTNFMKYGFTPGFGSTYIIPHRFGDTLGREMLFSAKSYYGAELKERGAGAKIVEKQDVITTAMAMAEELADKPRLSLLTLKRCFSDPIKRLLPEYIKGELAMHQLTFIQPEVRDRIERLFG